MDFFSKIESQFKPGYQESGRYVGHMIESIFQCERQIVLPIINKTGSGRVNLDRWRIESEYFYKNLDRRADLFLQCHDAENNLIREIAIEIKIRDGSSPENSSQFDDYIEWAKSDEDKRHVVALTAFPLNASLRKKVDESGCSSYYSIYDFAAQLPRDSEQPLIAFFLKYLAKKGFSMDEITKNDATAIRSFMVLNFLPSKNGHGRNSQYEKISLGPESFGKIVKNWQFFNSELLSRKMTTRYIPKQYYSSLAAEEFSSNFSERRNARNIKYAGKYWIFSEGVLDGSESNNIRLEIGLILSIQKGEDLTAQMYGLIRNKTKSLDECTMKLPYFFASHDDGKDKNYFSNLSSLRRVRKDILLKLRSSLLESEYITDVAREKLFESINKN